MTESTTIEATCPSCGKDLDRATGSRAPQPGDLNVCLYCAAPSRFGVGLRVVVLSDDDLLELPPEVIDELNETRSAVMQLLVSRGAGPKSSW